MDMYDWEKVLRENPNGVLATADGRKSKTRVFQYLFAVDGNACFCTSTDKPVYHQIKNNPYISFCAYSKDFNPVLSLNGRAVFLDDPSLKERALDENPHIKSIYGGADNPKFTIFWVELEEVETFSFAEGPRVYNA
jgi:uncharacterized pyridoxamine 5'-phosphate oxidase family protein